MVIIRILTQASAGPTRSPSRGGRHPGRPERSNTTNAKRERRFLLTTIALGHLTNDWVGGTIWLIAPAVAASMGLGPAEVGLLLAVNGIGAGLTYIPAGIATDRIARQGALLLITFWWVAIGYFAATLVDGFWPVTLLFAVGVMGDAFWHPVATGLLVKRLPGRKAQVLGIHAMGGAIGAELLGPLSAGFLLGYFDWREAMQILVLPALIMGLAFIPIARRIGVTAQQKMSHLDLKRLVRQWRSPHGIGLMAMMVVYNMALFAILAMTPLFLQTRHGLAPFEAAVAFAAMLSLGILCQPFVGHLSDRVGRKPVVLAMMLAAAAMTLAAAFATALAPFLIALVAAATLLNAVRPVVMAAAVEFSGQSEATTLGIVFAVLDGVGAIGALLAGLAGEIDLALAYVLAGGLALLAGLQAAALSFRAGPKAVSRLGHTPPAA